MRIASVAIASGALALCIVSPYASSQAQEPVPDDAQSRLRRLDGMLRRYGLALPPEDLRVFALASAGELTKALSTRALYVPESLSNAASTQDPLDVLTEFDLFRILDSSGWFGEAKAVDPIIEQYVSDTHGITMAEAHASLTKLNQLNRLAMYWSSAAPSFTGTWIDFESGNLHAAFTDAKALAQAREEARSIPGTEFTVAKFSLNDLKSGIGAIANLLRKDPMVDQTAWTISDDIPAGQLRVEFDPKRVPKETIREATDLLGPLPVNLVETEGFSVSESACPNSCSSPRGGMKISTSGHFCTSGFGLRNSSGQATFLSSAGHCSQWGLSWYHNSSFLGNQTWTSWPPTNSLWRQLDAMVFYSGPVSNTIYRPGNDPFPITSVAATGSIGTIVCHIGAGMYANGLSAQDCGPLTALYVTTSDHDNQGSYGPVRQCGGDSGGPVFSGNAAYGMHWGGIGTGCTIPLSSSSFGYFSWASTFQNLSGHSIQTGK